MRSTAIVLTLGKLMTNAAKTAHGLIRGSDRFQIVGIIDDEHAGQDAGKLLDGKDRGISIFENLETYLVEVAPEDRAQYCIVGIASAGGKLDPEWHPIFRQAIEAGISIVSGMHEFLSEQPELNSLAEQHGVELIDVRKPKAREELHFWTGAIHEVKAYKLAVLGTDCAVGKRTTARFIVEAAREAGRSAEMIFTGQTGWMQGSPYGFVFDSTVNDFVSGELEHAILQCDQEAQPELIVVEGQAALRNPSGPCGTEFLVSGMMDGVVLVHPPGREYYKGWQHTGRKIPPLATEIELIRLYGVPTIGIAINDQGLTEAEAREWKARFEAELGLPTVLPIQDGVSDLLPAIFSHLAPKNG